MSLLLIAVISYLLSATTAQDCTALANAGNCDFYTQCVEPKFQCGSSGYPLGYGNRYCRKFDQESSCFTPNGQAWINNVRICLMKAILNSTVYQSNETSCKDLQTFAFNSHPSCYVDNGFCTVIFLISTNLDCLAAEVFDLQDFFDKLAIQQIYSTITRCSSQAVKIFKSAVDSWIENARNTFYRLMLETMKYLLGDCTSSIDIVFALDASGSVGNRSFTKMKTFVRNVVSSFEIGDSKTRVGIIRYSSIRNVSIILPLGSINTTIQLSNFIDNIVYTGGNTATHSALNLLPTAFSTARTDQGIPRVAIVFTDGKSNSPTLTAQAAKLVHATGITVYSFGIGSGVNIIELNVIASSSSNVFLISGFSSSQFAAILLPLRTTVCTTPAISIISDEIEGILQTNEARLLEFPFPSEGMTLKVDITRGQLQVYGSFSIRNPTSLTADFSVQSTSAGIYYIISPKLYSSSTNTGLITKCQASSSTNTSAVISVYISLTGLVNNTMFSLNTTFGDAGSPVVYLISPSTLTGLLYGSITLEFNITNDKPRVTLDDITWLMNDTLLINRSRVSFSANRLSVTIDNLTLSDEGNYTLIACNLAGTDRDSVFLNIIGPPVIVESTGILNALENDNVTFTCNVHSETPHNKKWYFNGRALNDSNKYIITGENMTNSTLTIVNVSFADSGEYICSATNEHSQVNATNELTIQVRPSFITNPTNRTAVVGGNTGYTCSATGYPTPNISWIGPPGDGYTSNTIDTNTSLPIVHSQYTLIHLNSTNEGSYYCMAENDLAIKSIISTVATLSLQYPSNLLSGLSDQMQKESGTILLHCNYTGIPLPSITWYRNVSGNFTMIHNSEKVHIEETKSTENRVTDSYLQIINITNADDEGMYRCQGVNDVQNLIGATHLSEAFVSVHILPTVYPNENLYRLTGVKSYSVKLGFVIVPTVQSQSVQWHFTNLSNVTISLLTNTTAISSRYVFSDNFRNLTITDVQLSDRGNYTLTASNLAGVSSSMLYLDVHVEPRLLNKTGGYVLLDISKNSTQTLQLNCSAVGIPLPNIVWLYNGLLLINTSRVSILNIPVSMGANEVLLTDYSVLAITNLRETDGGNYVCRADNSDGSFDILDVPYSVNITHSPPPKVCEVNKARLEQICQNGGTCVDLTEGQFKCLCTESFTGDVCNTRVVIKIRPTLNDVKAIIGTDRQNSLLPPFYITGTLFQPLSLICSSSGSPQPITTWYKDGRIIYNLTDTLEFPELKLSDRGYYKCVVSSYLGKVESETFIVNISRVVQYSMSINISNSNITSELEIQNLLNEISNEMIGSRLPGTNGTFLSVTQHSNISQGLKDKEFNILVTILIDQINSTYTPTSLLKSFVSSLRSDIVIESNSIVRYDGCPSSTTVIPPPPGYPDLFIEINWPETNLGGIAVVECPCGGVNLNSTGLIATRKCGGESFESGGKWETPNDTRCNFSVIARRICALSRVPAEERVEELVSLTSNVQSFETAEVTASVAVLLIATEDIAGNISLTENYLNVVDNLAMADLETLQESNSEAKTSAKLLSAVDNVTSAIPVVLGEKPIVIIQNTFAVSAQVVEADHFEGQTFSVNAGSGENISLSFNNSADGMQQTASISLPSNLFRQLTGNSVHLVYSLFVNDALLLRRNKNNLEVGSVIISAGIVGVDRVENLTNPPVNIQFTKSPSVENGTRPQCVYWDADLDDGFGDWSSVGCAIDTTAFAGNDSRVLCQCTHLTSFSILLDVSPKAGDEKLTEPIDQALSAITYIGIIVSIICLAATIISYLAHKKLRCLDHGKLLINLCIALIGMYVTFIMGVHSTGVPVLCAIVGAMLQYFFLATFMIMAAQAIDLYYKLVVVVVGGKINFYVLKATLLCWTIPVFIVLFCFAPDYHNYYRQYFCRPFDAPFYVGLIVPFLLTYIFNWTMFIIIFVSLFYKHQNKEESKTEQLRHQLLVAVTLSVMFGLAWGIGLPATQSISDAAKPIRDTFASFFVVLTAFQGLFVFIMQCLKSPQIRQLWAGWFKTVFGYKESSSFSSSFFSKSNCSGNETNMSGGTNTLQKLVKEDNNSNIKDKVIACTNLEMSLQSDAAGSYSKDKMNITIIVNDVDEDFKTDIL